MHLSGLSVGLILAEGDGKLGHQKPFQKACSSQPLVCNLWQCTCRLPVNNLEEEAHVLQA